MFAKAPQPGYAKTRLIPLLGAEGAAALQARLIKHALRSASVALRGAIELHGTPIDDEFFRYCAGRYGVTLVEQSEGDLGTRMYTAFQRVLENGACASALLIGSDSPALTPRHLRRALHALESGHDAVFVPAEDGGYVLVGLKRVDARLFEGIGWSTEHVMEQTRERVRQLGWKSVEFETLWDVDRPCDYQRLVASGLLAR